MTHRSRRRTSGFTVVPKEKNELFEVVPKKAAGRPVNPSKEPEIFFAKPSIWSAVYRRDFLSEHGIDFLETPGASFQDSAFNFKVWACADRVVFLNEPVLHYRQDNESSSVNSPSKVYCICDEHAEMDRFLEAHPEKQGLWGVKEKVKLDNYLWNYERLASPLNDEFLQRMHEEFKADMAAGRVDFGVFEPWKKKDFQIDLRFSRAVQGGPRGEREQGARFPRRAAMCRKAAFRCWSRVLRARRKGDRSGRGEVLYHHSRL